MSASADLQPTAALRAIRHHTVGRARKAWTTWVGRSIGWSTLLYLVGWGVVFALSGWQSLGPAPEALEAFAARWLPALTSLLVVLGAWRAARSRVIPVALDRRDLQLLTFSQVPPALVLRWPTLRSLAPGWALAAVLGVAWALLATRWLGWQASFAPLMAPLLLMLFQLLAWRSAVRGRRLPLPWTALALAAAAATVASAVLEVELGLGQLGGALLGTAPLWLGSAVCLALAALVWVLAWRTVHELQQVWPQVVSTQSQAIATLRAMAASRLLTLVSGSMPTYDDAFATARLRDRLHGRPTAWRPRWRLPAPGRRGATAAAIWSAWLRRPRAHPYLPWLWPFAVLSAVAAALLGGVVGTPAWWPALGMAWAAAQFAPGKVPWPAWPVSPRAMMMAHVLPTSLLAGVGLLGGMALAPFLPTLDLAAGLAAIGAAAASGVLVSFISGRTGAPAHRFDTVLLVALIVSVPAVLIGWFGGSGEGATLAVTLLWWSVPTLVMPALQPAVPQAD